VPVNSDFAGTKICLAGIFCITVLDYASIQKFFLHSSSIFHISLEMPLFIGVLSMEEKNFSSMHLPYFNGSL